MNKPINLEQIIENLNAGEVIPPSTIRAMVRELQQARIDLFIH